MKNYPKMVVVYKRLQAPKEVENVGKTLSSIEFSANTEVCTFI